MGNMIGKQAPDWSATVYDNGEKKTMGGEDLKGGWYLIYWYPFDFTLICPTEIVGFEALKEEFEDDGITVIGCSTDSYFSHKAWFADKAIFPAGVTHPVIGDTTHEVTKDFNMMNKAMGVGFRGTVLVNPDGNVEMYSINGMSAGRSPSEILRTCQATQAGGLCGANWTKGDSFIA